MKRPDTEFLLKMARQGTMPQSTVVAVRAAKAAAVLDYISWLEGWREGAQSSSGISDSGQVAADRPVPSAPWESKVT